jgi:acyl-CoA thioesterase I
VTAIENKHNTGEQSSVTKILFIGDSITDCGRREPNHAPLGIGYVRLFADLTAIRQPQRQDITILNRGIGGNTVENLRSRWHDDVLLHRPDLLSIKIGINDLNQYLSHNNPPLSPEGYETTLRQLLTVTREQLPQTQLLLLTPFYLSSDAVDGSYRRKVGEILPQYIGAVKRLSEEFETRYIDFHAVFQEQLKHHHPDRFCPEPVHPYLVGHLLMAEAVYTALEEVLTGA